MVPSSKQYIETNQSREECLKTVVEALNVIGDVSQEKVRIKAKPAKNTLETLKSYQKIVILILANHNVGLKIFYRSKNTIHSH